MIIHAILSDGAFVAGCTSSGLTCYAYPTSTSALAARREPNAIAEEMIGRQLENPCLDHRAEYDRRNWARINAGREG